MEANEAHELQEHAEHGAHEPTMKPVAFTMSVLAVLVAISTLLGHRTHTEAIIAQTRAAVEQNRATDLWNFYQAKKIRASDTGLIADLLSDVSVANKDKAAKDLKSYADHQSKWNSDLKEEEKQAREQEDKVKELQSEVAAAEARANRFDLGEVLLEIGLVVTSVTLLTRTRGYWYFGMAFAAGGVVSVVLGLLLQ
jgi:hypothetical protein